MSITVICNIPFTDHQSDWFYYEFPDGDAIEVAPVCDTGKWLCSDADDPDDAWEDEWTFDTREDAVHDYFRRLRAAVVCLVEHERHLLELGAYTPEAQGPS